LIHLFIFEKEILFVSFVFGDFIQLNKPCGLHPIQLTGQLWIAFCPPWVKEFSIAYGNKIHTHYKSWAR
jgi:hypothetical protein